MRFTRSASLATVSLLAVLTMPLSALAQTVDEPTMYSVPASTSTPFSDVPLHDPAFVSITCLRVLGVVHGNVWQPSDPRPADQISFTPTRTLTRDEALKIVLRSGAMNIDSQQQVQMDQTFGQNLSALIQQAMQQGIINPVVEEKAFRPGDEITRGEFLKIALRANGVRIAAADQVSDADRAALPIDVDPKSTLLPEFVTGVRLNLLEPKLASWDTVGYVIPLSWLSWSQLENLKQTETVALLKPNDSITRKEAADLLYRVLSLKRRGFSQSFTSGSAESLCQDLVDRVKADPLKV